MILNNTEYYRHRIASEFIFLKNEYKFLYTYRNPRNVWGIHDDCRPMIYEEVKCFFKDKPHTISTDLKDLKDGPYKVVIKCRYLQHSPMLYSVDVCKTKHLESDFKTRIDYMLSM